MPDPDDQAPDPAAQARRRFARRQWARRWLQWRAVVAAGVVVALVAAAMWALFFSGLVAVREVHVEGAVDSLSPDQVRVAAAVPAGQPLARVDLADVRRRVEALPAVASADVIREWPHAVRIDVRERVAIAVVEAGTGLRGMDASGVVFRDYAQAPPGLPRVLVSTQATRDARREAARVIAALPSTLAATVDHLSVASVDRISLVLRDGRTVVWGSADESDEKADVLAALLKRRAQFYDVSVPGQPVTRN